ncbi:hepatic and glial cell adhesion molecule isoform X4 [Platichthys flesus]|uniref:hepatic and glial cell adhesion molecule isoform X4 n=1 Tax=Platichthys flesus TaxID=8260 RepID=UPI002DB8DF36|nr:hepatic and glial cell adhesion molecule isoform X4 [Platichthys flesus]
MEAVFGLLLMLLGVSHGVETKCDFRQKKGAQCYGALGGTVVLQLMDRAAERFIIRKNATKILSWQNNNFTVNMSRDKYSFTPSDGMLRINNLIRSDADEYTLEIYNSDGALLENRTLQLSIQAPVSPVRLVPECLSQGEMRVSCSSEGGDSPQYSWTLDGRTLTEDKLLSGNHQTDNITLRQNVEGDLLCSVKNHVSHLNSSKRISSCGFIFINCTDSNETRITQWVFAASNTLCVEPPTTHKAGDMTVVMAGLLAALVFFLVVGGAVMCALKKKKTNQLEEEGDEQELTYADVRIKQRGPVQQRANPEEVEYGQIKFSERPRRTVEPREDDCVYAKVR